MDRIRVLAADDNPLVRKQLEAFLNGKDDLELVGVAEDGTGALEIMREKPVDVLLLDMVMPKMDGFSVLKEMNTLDLVHKPHVIVITALMRDDFIQRALSLGVDYYMLKPFEPEELLARVENILRRARKERTRFVFDALTVDLPSRRVTKDGREVALTALEFDLLAMLVCRNNVALSREALLAGVWGYAYQGETRTVDVHIQRLRGKIGAEYIETVYKYGYRFCGKEVERR